MDCEKQVWAQLCQFFANFDSFVPFTTRLELQISKYPSFLWRTMTTTIDRLITSPLAHACGVITYYWFRTLELPDHICTSFIAGTSTAMSAIHNSLRVANLRIFRFSMDNDDDKTDWLLHAPLVHVRGIISIEMPDHICTSSIDNRNTRHAKWLTSNTIVY